MLPKVRKYDTIYPACPALSVWVGVNVCCLWQQRICRFVFFLTGIWREPLLQSVLLSSVSPQNISSIKPVPSWPSLDPWDIWETSAAINPAQIFQINKFTMCKTPKITFHVRSCLNLCWPWSDSAGTWGPYDCLTATEDLIHSPGAAWWWYVKLQPVLFVRVFNPKWSDTKATMCWIILATYEDAKLHVFIYAFI